MPFRKPEPPSIIEQIVSVFVGLLGLIFVVAFFFGIYAGITDPSAMNGPSIHEQRGGWPD